MRIAFWILFVLLSSALMYAAVDMPGMRNPGVGSSERSVPPSPPVQSVRSAAPTLGHSYRVVVKADWQQHSGYMIQGKLMSRKDGKTANEEVTFGKHYSELNVTADNVSLSLRKKRWGEVKVELYRDGSLVASDESSDDVAFLLVSG